MSHVPRPRASRRSALAIGLVLLSGCTSSGAATRDPSGAPTATPAATVAVESPGASPSGVPTAAAGDVVRIELSGSAPDAIVLQGDRAWVTAGEGGSLMEVDLVGGEELRAIEVGFGPTHLALPRGDLAAVARFDDSGNGFFLELVDLETEEVAGIATGALGGLALGEDGIVWVLEKADRVLKVDTATGRVVDDAPVDVGDNVHLEVQWGAGSAWVGSDGMPTTRLAETDLVVEDAIDVPTGLPFLFEDGLMWGAGPTELWAIDPATNEITVHVPLADVIEVLGLDIEGDDAWLAVRRPGHVGRVLRLDLASGGAVVEEHDVSLPAAVRLSAERAWVASYLTDELLGFPR